MGLSIELAERSWLPDALIRVGIRRLLQQRLKTLAQGSNVDTPRGKPIAIETHAANEQHYEVSPAFFARVLGPHLKYSCCWYESAEATLAEAESAMLHKTCEHAGLEDGMSILELGCGWGSLTLWMAAQYPNSPVTAVSNSHAQRETIEELARERGLDNVTVVTADINQFRPDQRFDRIVSVEMFEHVRNHTMLLERIAQWLRPDGRLFVHVFCHREHSYTYEDRGDADWMARHFFSGGMMPSFDYLPELSSPLKPVERWNVNGMHYARTCRDWLARLDAQRDEIEALFAHDMSPAAAAIQVQRWRMFFMACEELFAWKGGDEWHVGHYLFEPAAVAEEEAVAPETVTVSL